MTIRRFPLSFLFNEIITKFPRKLKNELKSVPIPIRFLSFINLYEIIVSFVLKLVRKIQPLPNNHQPNQLTNFHDNVVIH